MEKPLNLLLADDDKDDRFFFNKVLQELSIRSKLTTVEDGEKLMHYLSKNYKNLPNILFLDLNMPRKNGSECLSEIKNNNKLKELPVVIYSTSLHEDVADLLYQKGAHYYVRKSDIVELKKVLEHVLKLMVASNFARPERSRFIINVIEV